MAICRDMAAFQTEANCTHQSWANILKLAEQKGERLQQ